MKHSSRIAWSAGSMAVVLSVLSGCGDGGGGGGEESPSPTPTRQSPSPAPTGTASPTPGATERATVSLDSVDDLGRILTDAEGLTLYLFEADTSQESTCYDACAEAWPPLTTSGEPQAGGDVQADLLGVTQRRNGATQVTYDGHPLYYYEGDDEPGETQGQGLDQFGALWYVVDASGKAVRNGQGQDGQEQDGQEDDGTTSGGY